MRYPGDCRCTWLVDGGDTGEDTVGTFQPIAKVFPIPSIGAIEYRRVANQFVWQLTLSRWYSPWLWTNADSRYYGFGWGWSRWGDSTDNDCSAGFGNPYWGGLGGFGYNGWGWGYGGGAAWNYPYGETGSLYRVTYSLQSGTAMSCSGSTVRFYLNQQLDNPDFDPAHWPAYVDIARVQK